MPSIARCIISVGGFSPAPANRRRKRARADSAFASGSCTPQTPCSVQATPHTPMAVSNSAKYAAVMTDILPCNAGRTWRILLSMRRARP